MGKKIAGAILLAGCVAGVLLVSGSFAATKSVVSGELTSVFRSPHSFFDRLLNRTPTDESVISLMRENERLKAVLLELRKEPRRTAVDALSIRAQIYSTYPFNDHGLMSVNAGEEDGVRKGMTVTVDGVIFLGQVTEVYPRMSVIRTVFDSNWQVPVKVGDDRTNGLLVGGRAPVVTLVARESPLEPGAEVYAASRDFPYGLKVGEAARVEDSPSTNFKGATVRLAFDPADLTEVVILAR